MTALGLVNGLFDLGVTFEVDDGRLVQASGAPLTGAVAKQVTAHDRELAALCASPCVGPVETQAIFGPADVYRVALLVSAGPYIAVGEVGGNLALTSDGVRVAVVPAERAAILLPALRALLIGANVASWGPTPLAGLDLQLPARLLETAGDLAAGGTLTEVVTSLLPSAAPLEPKADDMARLTYTTRAVGVVGAPILDHIESRGMGPVLRLERNVALVLEGATDRGVRFDVAAWKLLVEQREGDLEHYATIVRKHLDAGVADQPALLDALRARGIPVESAKSDEITLFSDDAAVDAILRAREAKGFVEGTGRPIGALLAKSRDGRLHPQFHPLGESARISASAPSIISVPRDARVRRCIIPNDGCAFVEGDFSGSQLRIVAHLLRVPKLLDLFSQGIDVHRWMASQYLECAIDEVSDAQKPFGKSANFGLLYAVGVDGFRTFAREQYGIYLRDQEARRLMEVFFTAFPEVGVWHAAEKARPTEVAVTPLGRRLYLGRPDITFNGRLARMIQAIEADALKTALVELAEPLRRLGGGLVLPIYDALLIEVPMAHVAEASRLLVETMERAMTRFIPSVPVVAKSKTGTNWSFAE